MNEKEFWHWLQPKLAEQFFIQRIENMVGAGVPDVHLCHRRTGKEVWLELKYAADWPVHDATPVFSKRGLRPEQISWISARSRAGMRILIVARVRRELFLVLGHHAAVFNEWGRGRLSRGCENAFKLPLSADLTSSLNSAVLGGG